MIQHDWSVGTQSYGNTYYTIDSNGSLKVLEAWSFQYDPNPNKQYWYSSTSADFWGNRKAFKHVKVSYIDNLISKYEDTLSFNFTPVFD